MIKYNPKEKKLSNFRYAIKRIKKTRGKRISLSARYFSPVLINFFSRGRKKDKRIPPSLPLFRSERKGILFWAQISRRLWRRSRFRRRKRIGRERTSKDEDRTEAAQPLRSAERTRERPWVGALARWHVPEPQTGTRRLSGKWMKSSEPVHSRTRMPRFAADPP